MWTPAIRGKNRALSAFQSLALWLCQHHRISRNRKRIDLSTLHNVKKPHSMVNFTLQSYTVSFRLLAGTIRGLPVRFLLIFRFFSAPENLSKIGRRPPPPPHKISVRFLGTTTHPRAPCIICLCPLGVCSVSTIGTGGPARSNRRSYRGMRVGSPVFGIQPHFPKFSMESFGVEPGLLPFPVNLQAWKACKRWKNSPVRQFHFLSNTFIFYC